MADLFTRAFFDDLVEALNGNDEFKQRTANVTTTVLMVNKDTNASYILAIDKGSASASDAEPDTKADFTFIGDTPTWIANHKGEAPMEKLVMTGKLKFKGSIPKIMSMRSQLGIIDKVAQSVPADNA